MVPQKIHYIYIHTSTAVRRNAAFSSHLCVICKETLSSDFGATFLRERLTGPSLKASFFLRPTFQLVCWKIFSLQKNLIPNPTFLHFFPKIYGFYMLLWYSTKTKSHLSLRQGPHQPWWKAQENTTKAGTRSLDNDGNLPRA